MSGRAKYSLKSSRSARVEQDRLRPPFAGAEHVAVREAAAHDQAAEVVETQASLEQIGHVHVVRDEAGAMECRRHLDVTVDALLAQDRDLRPRALGDVRRCDVLLRLERQPDIETRIVGLQSRCELLSRALGIVAELDHAEAGLGPGAAQCSARFVEHDFAAGSNDHAICVRHATDHAREASEAVTLEHLTHGLRIVRTNLQHRAELFAE